MKCFNCGKNFDYEKYYGICPKCGSFNKEETPQEQHQRYHDEYDNGYHHTEHTYTGAVLVRENVEKGKNGKNGRGSTVFLLISIVIFVITVCGLTAFGFLYSRSQEKKLLNEVAEFRVERKDHAVGETFALQGMTLSVEGAWIVDEGRETNPNLPEGKRLIAVKLRGESDGEWSDKNRLSTAYINCGGLYYEQLPSYETDENRKYGEAYDIPIFETVSLCMEKEAEGCLMFWVDEDRQDFTLCLEERADKEPVFIQAIHTIDIHLEIMNLGGQENG